MSGSACWSSASKSPPPSVCSSVAACSASGASIAGVHLRIALGAAQELLRGLARRAEREQQALELRAARTALADQREVEDLARQVGEVERARQAAEFRDADARILGALTRHEAHREAGPAQQLRQQVGVLPVEVDQDDATGAGCEAQSGSWPWSSEGGQRPP